MVEIIIYLFLITGVIIGYRQGGLKQIGNLVGIVLGLFIAIVLYNQFGDLLVDKTGAAVSTGLILAFVGIVFFVPLILGWITSLLTELLKKLKLNFFNRILGAVVGLVSYILMLSVGFNILDFVASNGGYRPQKLDVRPQIYYQIKYITQAAIPNILIVTDTTEVKNGVEPKNGIKSTVDKASEQLNLLNEVNLKKVNE